MLSNYAENAILLHFFKSTTYSQPTHLYVGLSTADPKGDNSGLAEPAGNNYARVSFDTWTIAANVVSNNGAITFPQASGSWGTISHWGIFDALTNGNLIARGPLDAAVYKFVAVASNSTFYVSGQGSTFANNTIVRLYAKTNPGGFSGNTLYYVINAALGDDSFQLSLTNGGSAVTVSSDNAGFIGVDGSKAIGTNDTPSFATGQLALTLE